MDLLMAFVQIMEMESCIFISHPRSFWVSGSGGKRGGRGLHHSALNNLENILPD